MQTTHWTRQEVIKLANLTRGEFQGFEKLNLVKPFKLPIGKKGVIVYNWEQLIIVKVYAKLREKAPLQTIREALIFLNESNAKEILTHKKLIVFRNKICWVNTDSEFTQVIQKDAKHLITTCEVKNLLNEIFEAGQKAEIYDFENRYNQSFKSSLAVA